jgi:hypothetical protein
MNAPDYTSDWAKARLATPAGQIERSMIEDLANHLPAGWRMATTEEAAEHRHLRGVLVFDPDGDPHVVNLPVMVDWLLPRERTAASRFGLDDPNREAMLADLRERIRAVDGDV